VTTARTLHHVARPEVVVAEADRVLRPGGTLLVVDQLAPGDPMAAIELNRFERARDPSTTRVLADVDLRGLFDSNNLVLRRAEIIRERRISTASRPRGLHGRGARAGARVLAPPGTRERLSTAGTCAREAGLWLAESCLKPGSSRIGFGSPVLPLA
jgi:SAM-dependent methyltransferase